MKTKLSIATQALIDISEPITAMRRYAESKGAELNGHMAYTLSNDPYHLKNIAKKALSEMTEVPTLMTNDDMREIVSDEDIRELLSQKDVGSGRAKLRQIINKMACFIKFENEEPCYECGSTERMGTACAPCNPEITDKNFGYD